MREKPVIPDELLKACLQDHYDLSVVTLEFLPLGLDTRAGVYRAVSEQGSSYLVKVKSGTLYEPACFIPRYLADQGIAAVVAPIPTRTSALWTQLCEWTVLVYPFIEGISSWTPGLSEAEWKATGTALKQIHQAVVPFAGFPSVRKERFDPAEYLDWIRDFEAQQMDNPGGSPNEQALRSCWLANYSTLHVLLTAMEKLAQVLQSQSGPYVICHADLHPGNLIRVEAGQVFVIDWDDVMLAPKERDFLFVGEGTTSGAASPEISPFFQGYGEAEVDWVALTYYRAERVIQDLIACAQDVFFRDDLEEETRAEAVQLFRDILAEGGEAGTAFATAVHLPAHLTFTR